MDRRSWLQTAAAGLASLLLPWRGKLPSGDTDWNQLGEFAPPVGNESPAAIRIEQTIKSSDTINVECVGEFLLLAQCDWNQKAPDGFTLVQSQDLGDGRYMKAAYRSVQRGEHVSLTAATPSVIYDISGATIKQEEAT